MPNKKYFVTANFKLEGECPYSVDSDIIKDRVVDDLNGLELEISGNSFGNDDMVYAFFNEGDVFVDVNEFSVEYTDKPFCECCGERYDDYGVEIENGGTCWCLDCVMADVPNLFSEAEEQKIRDNIIEGKKKFHREKLKRLEKE